MSSKKRVTYMWNDNMDDYYYSPISMEDNTVEQHPMQPIRIDMTNKLVNAYNLEKYLNIEKSIPCAISAMESFHSSQYIDFLKNFDYYKKSLAKQEFEEMESKFNMRKNENGNFKGLFDFVSAYTGASLRCAERICNGQDSICINWAGGLHHAMKSKASGFCYINDIVLCINTLLRSFKRVLYIDIDCHAGDGVQEAFVESNRVLTLSFHGFMDGFFPYTGSIKEVGTGNGKNYSVNVPLLRGCNDDAYWYMFKPIVDKVCEKFQPQTIILQCGADSLGSDILGMLNLSSQGHSRCVDYIVKKNMPLILLGGGGYSLSSVAKCWTTETAVAVGIDLEKEIPMNNYYMYYAHQPSIDVSSDLTIFDRNSRNYLNSVIAEIIANVELIENAPSVA